MASPSDKCSEIRFALPLYVGGDLDPEELGTVREHLADCAPCRAHEERARVARELLVARAGTGFTGDTPSLWEGVRTALVAEGLLAGAPVSRSPVSRSPVSRRIGPRPLAPRSRWVIGSAAAAAALVFAFGLSGLLGPAGGIHGEGARLAGDPALLRSQAATPVNPAVAERLQHVGENGQPLLENAVDLLPEQNIMVPSPSAQPSPAGSLKKLRPGGNR